MSYQVTNDTGATLNDVWVDLTNFAGGVVSLAPNETGLAHLGTMINGQSKTAFFYLQATGATAVAQTHTVSVYATRPPAAALATANFSYTVADTIQANANKVVTVVATPNSPTLGTLVVVTVTGETGTIGAANILSFTPASYADRPADALRLYSTSITLSGGNTGTFTDQLLIPPASITSSANTGYTAVYTFRAIDTTAISTPVSPVGYISSGAQVKHTDTGSFTSLAPIPPITNQLTLSKSVSPTQALAGATVTFTLTLTNASLTNDSIIEDFVDTLPAGVTYVAGTSKFNGASIADPAIAAQTLTWVGMYSIPANTSRTLTFQATLPAGVGAYVNSAVAHIGTAQVDTTLPTTDNSPATATVNVVPNLPDLTVNKSHSGNFTQGQNGATYTIVVSNIGPAASSGTITVTDVLPVGLTFVSGSGGGFTCSAVAQTVTCTSTTSIASLGSATITLTVNVASNAPASITNPVSVACTCSETNTNNNAGSDPTAINQLPDLTITKGHVGNFTQGQTNAAYSITVNNIGSSGTSGTITVTDILPTGLTFVSGSGGGFTCSAVAQTVTCTSTTAIAAPGSALITLLVNVAANAPSSLINPVSVACTCTETNTGNNTASDPTGIIQLPDLTISKAHAGVFAQGQLNAAYTITVSNIGSGTATGTITVTDVLPTGLTFVSGSGGGFTCIAVVQTVTCTSVTPIAPLGSAVITLLVNVAGNAPSSVTNTVSVACSCTEINTGNNGATDPTVIGGFVSDAFQLKYFNTNYGSGQIIVTNAGSAGFGSQSDDSASTICANFYSFDPNEEMQTCCSCPVTPNGLASLQVNEDIVAQNLIVNPSTAITVKVLFTLKAGQNNGGACDPSKPTGANLVSGGLAWGTNLRTVTFNGSPATQLKSVTETKFHKAELSPSELSKLATYCQYIKILGSSVSGICKSCQAGARGSIAQ